MKKVLIGIPILALLFGLTAHAQTVPLNEQISRISAEISALRQELTQGPTFGSIYQPPVGNGNIGTSTTNLTITNATTTNLVLNSSTLVNGYQNFLVNPDTGIPLSIGTDTFYLSGRPNIGIPVPDFTPYQANQNIAFDVFPKGPTITNAFGNSIYGAAWEDICSSDLYNFATSTYECLHLGKSVNTGPGTGYMNISSEVGGNGSIQPLEFQAFGWAVVMGGSTPQASLMDIGNQYTYSSSVGPFQSGNEPTVAISANTNGSDGVIMENINTSTLADFRFAVMDTTGHYLALSEPGIGNTQSTLFGQNRSSSDFIFNNGGTTRNMTIGTVASSSLILGTNNTARLTIASSGNIGIGTSSAANLLTLQSTGGSTNPFDIYNSQSGQLLQFREDSGHNGQLSFFSSGGTTNVLLTTNTSSLSYFASGPVAIGTSTQNSTANLTIVGSTTFSGLTTIDTATASSTLVVGDATHYGCIEFGTPAGLVYEYATTTSPFVIATTTKPSFACN